MPLSLFLILLGSSFVDAAESTAPGRCQTSEAETCTFDAEGEMEEELSLMQLRGQGVLTKELRMREGSREQAHLSKLQKDYNFIQDLLKKHAKEGKLPAEIRPFITMIHDNAVNIQGELQKTHEQSAADGKAHQDSFTTCDTERETNINAAHSKHQEPAAVLAKDHCDCRAAEGKLFLDHLGLEGYAQCSLEKMNQKKKAMDDFMATNHCEACEQPMYNSKAVTEINAEKMHAWLMGRGTECAAHWDQVHADFVPLEEAYNQATTQHENAVTAADQKATEHGEKAKACDGSQSQVTQHTCNYRSAVQNACGIYEQCHSDAVGAWNSFHEVESVDSKDRQNAWVAAEQVKCILTVFISGETGPVEIDTNQAKACDGLTAESCKSHEGCAALHMDELLGYVPPKEQKCVLPDEHCANGSFQPTCKGKMGSYTPAYDATPGTPDSCESPGKSTVLCHSQAPLATCSSCSGA